MPADASAIPPSRVVALALIVGVFFTAQVVFMALTTGRPLRVEWDVLQELLYWVLWALLAPRVLALARRWPLDARPVLPAVLRHVATSLPLAAVQTVSAFALHLVALVAVGAVPARLASDWMIRQRASLVWGEFMGVFFYWLVVGVYTMFRFQRLYDAERLSVAEHASRSATLEAALAGAQLDALRSQLRPHFLFNTLNSIAVLAREDADKAQRMVIRLGSLLRRSLDEEEHEVPLRQELTFLDDYLDIQRVRFGDRLTVSLTVDPAAADARVPVLLLQPIVENAIEHGWSERGDEGDGTTRIALRADRVANRLQIVIEDDGPGPGDGARGREGIGLGNTRERLRRLYGDRATMTLAAVGANGASGTRVDITLPFSAASA